MKSYEDKVCIEWHFPRKWTWVPSQIKVNVEQNGVPKCFRSLIRCQELHREVWNPQGFSVTVILTFLMTTS